MNSDLDNMYDMTTRQQTNVICKHFDYCMQEICNKLDSILQELKCVNANIINYTIRKDA